MTKRNKDIFIKLGEMFPLAHCELDYHNNYELLIMISLSAQTTDKKVNNVSLELFNKYHNYLELSNANIDDLINIIKPLGLAKTKAKNLIELSKKLVSDGYATAPADYDYLVGLAGVGRKSAHCYLSEAYALNYLAVDTHVARVAYRLKLTSETDPLKVEKDLIKEYNDIKLIDLHHRMIAFGRYVCKKQKPMCSACPFIKDCRERENG